MQETLKVLAQIFDIVQGYCENKITGDQGMAQIHDLLLELCIKELPEGVQCLSLDPRELHTELAKALGEKP